MKITIVTGNPGKVREIQAMADNRFDFVMHSLDLTEIQSLDLHEIVKDKLERAYAAVKAPVIVEDVSAGLDNLAGLPGPFFKFFEKELGQEAFLRLTPGGLGEPVTISCLAGFYDGKTMLFGQGVLKGKTSLPHGSHGFGFDPVVVPDGQSRTMAEMTPEEKSAVSHRGQAFRALLAQLEKLA